MIIKKYRPYGTCKELDQIIDGPLKDRMYSVIDAGYGLDKIRRKYGKSFDWYIAGQGYMLDELIHSEDVDTRAAVADRGYGLDLLAKDRWPYVRMCVDQYLVARGYKNIDEWAEKNPDRCVLIGK